MNATTASSPNAFIGGLPSSSPKVSIGDPEFRLVRSWIPDQNRLGNDGVEKLRE